MCEKVVQIKKSSLQEGDEVADSQALRITTSVVVQIKALDH